MANRFRETTKEQRVSIRPTRANAIPSQGQAGASRRTQLSTSLISSPQARPQWLPGPTLLNGLNHRITKTKKKTS